MATLVDKKLPAGNYLIIDLCYVMHKEWNEICEALAKEGNPDVWTIELDDGRLISGAFTQNGDGTYYSSLGRDFYVDSGSIGVIRVEDVRIEEAGNIETGQIKNFSHEFELGYNCGDIMIGNVVIHTGVEPDSDEWDLDYSEYDEDYDEED